jgi:hypothetical protein
VGTHFAQGGVAVFARLNMACVVLALAVAWMLLREYRLTAPAPAAGPLPAAAAVTTG